MGDAQGAKDRVLAIDGNLPDRAAQQAQSIKSAAALHAQRRDRLSVVPSPMLGIDGVKQSPPSHRNCGICIIIIRKLGPLFL
jgi:hypothetical protein